MSVVTILRVGYRTAPTNIQPAPESQADQPLTHKDHAYTLTADVPAVTFTSSAQSQLAMNQSEVDIYTDVYGFGNILQADSLETSAKSCADNVWCVLFQISGPSTALFYPHIAVGASGWNRLYLVYFETHTWREPCPNILLQCSVQL